MLCWPLIALAVAGIHDNSCSGYAGFWPSLLAAAPQRQGNAKTRVDGVLAALGSVCSSYAGFRPWLLAAAPRRQGNAKTRVD